jgi:protein TonB
MDAEAASETVEDENEEQVFEVVEVAPEFPGGMNGLMIFLRTNIEYPRISRDNNSQGRVLVQFVVNSDGSIQDVEVVRSSGDVYLDNEAVRVVESMPEWKPGMQKGKTVRVKYRLPINFRLQ